MFTSVALAHNLSQNCTVRCCNKSRLANFPIPVSAIGTVNHVSSKIGQTMGSSAIGRMWGKEWD